MLVRVFNREEREDLRKVFSATNSRIIFYSQRLSKIIREFVAEKNKHKKKSQTPIVKLEFGIFILKF